MSDTISEPPGDGPKNEARPIDVAESTRHELLAVPRRRLTVDILEGRVASLDLDTVARGLAVREQADPSPETVERIAIELHHNHLPRLDEYELIEYEPKARLVHATGTTLEGVEPTNTDSQTG